jgi:glutamate N-acetyltransferase/amino-acid N-acetyltransferase
MATVLGFITTDAPLSGAACDAALRGAVGTTFNRVTIDGDTSTNDMVLLMASGTAGGAIIDEADARFGPVAHAVHRVCEDLARMIARDGEGATTLVDVVVTGAADDADAALVAFTVAESPLVKTAIFGRDANWGRVAMAVGRSHARIDPARLEIRFAGILTCKEGTAVPFDEDAALAALSASEVEIAVDLHLGEGMARVWTCDLTCDYVKINADYRT